MLVWFRDPKLQAIADTTNADGRVDPGTGDFTGVVDTSVSYGKVLPYIDRKVDYRRLPDGTSLVRVTYSNQFPATPGAPWDPLIDGTWWDWQDGTFHRVHGAW